MCEGGWNYVFVSSPAAPLSTFLRLVPIANGGRVLQPRVIEQIVSLGWRFRNLHGCCGEDFGKWLLRVCVFSRSLIDLKGRPALEDLLMNCGHIGPPNRGRGGTWCAQQLV